MSESNGLTVSDNTTLRLTLEDPQGTAIDLTGTTVDLLLNLNGTSSTVNATVDDQIQFLGRITYAFLNADLSAPGRLEVKARITSGSQTFTSSTPLFFNVVTA